jgi:carbonic anhydrase
LAGCEQIQGLVGPKPAHAESTGKADKPEKEANERAEESSKTAKADGDSEFALPFAWETSLAEPLGQARGFLREVYAANGDYARQGPTLFPASSNKQGPRATVITCADASVQAGAFDGSPENDDFTVRNIGNIVESSLGSVAYGVEQLNTPVLLVVGHTGCGAVKAAIDAAEGRGKRNEPDSPERAGEAISNEIAKIRISKETSKKPAGEAWARAVIDNVREQVGVSLQKFGRRVHAGKLTVVGAVLDLGNEMGFGAGRLIIVDVNGTHDEQRIAAFNRAIVGGQATAPANHVDQAKRGADSREDGTAEAEPTNPEPEHTKLTVPPKAAAGHAKESMTSRPKRAAKQAAEQAERARQAARDDETAKALVQALATLPAARGRLASE